MGMQSFCVVARASDIFFPSARASSVRGHLFAVPMYWPNELIGEHGYQDCKVEYPEISSIVVFKGVEKFYKKFYFRPSYIMRTLVKMAFDSRERKRLIREGRQFKEWMAKRQDYLKNAEARIANRRKMQFAANPIAPGKKMAVTTGKALEVVR